SPPQQTDGAISRGESQANAETGFGRDALGRAPELHQHLLQHILGGPGIAQDAQGYRVDQARILIVERTHRLLLARGNERENRRTARRCCLGFLFSFAVRVHRKVSSISAARRDPAPASAGRVEKRYRACATVYFIPKFT